MDSVTTPESTCTKKPHPTRERGAGPHTNLVLRRLGKDDGRGEVVPNAGVYASF
jgi:hypothetical protein